MILILFTLPFVAKQNLIAFLQLFCQLWAALFYQFFYRVNDAVYQLLHEADVFTREEMIEQAQKHMVCPFELCLEKIFFIQLCAVHLSATNHYIVYSQLTDEKDFMLELFCVDPSRNLQQCMQKGRSTVLFSATLLPIQYYKRLLGGDSHLPYKIPP